MTEPSPQLSLAVGDRVVYPNQGVCRVTAVDTKEVAGQKLVFVTLKREEDGAVVMVPEAKVRTIGVRKVASPEDIDRIFAFLVADGDKADLDWKQRARANTDRMSQGGIQGLVEVVKGLQVLSELRPLPNKERELYDNARHLLVAEISASLGISECNAEDSIDVALFPPGKERPKRTAAEFKPQGAGDEDGLDLPEDLLQLDSDLETPAEEEGGGAEGEDEEKAGRAVLSDEEPTVTMVRALKPEDLAPPKRKRGRPPKPKPEPIPGAPPPAPKKRGRPPKPKPEVVTPPVPKKRGRPPKAASEKAAPAKTASKPVTTKAVSKPAPAKPGKKK